MKWWPSIWRHRHPSIFSEVERIVLIPSVCPYHFLLFWSISLSLDIWSLVRFGSSCPQNSFIVESSFFLKSFWISLLTLLSNFDREINSEIQNDFRKKLDSTMKEFWGQLEPNLTKDQISRLKEMDQKRMEMIRANRRISTILSNSEKIEGCLCLQMEGHHSSPGFCKIKGTIKNR